MLNGPVFGIRLPGCSYVVRPSAYALVRAEDGRLAVVRERRGWFLPGGGIEGHEGPEGAAQREAREECGLVIEARGIVARATEIVHSPSGNGGIDKDSFFIEAVVLRPTSATEPDHELVWLTAEEAARRLSQKSHRWAVGLPVSAL